MPRMDDGTLKAICEAKINNSLGWVGDSLSQQRIQAMDYYRGMPFGNEQEGRSQVISRDVAEAIDSVMPGMIKVFASTDRVVICEAKSESGEDAAAQATDYLNYTLNSQPNWFMTLHTWIKDGLLSKLGVVKCWWEETAETKKESYEGITPAQYAALILNDDVEVVSELIRAADPPELTPDQIIQQQTQNVMAAAPQAPMMPAMPQQQQIAPAQPARPVDPGAAQAAAAQQKAMDNLQRLADLQDGTLIDCEIRRTTKSGHMCIVPVPGEEFLTERRAISLDTVNFACHRTRKTVTELVEDGFDPEIVKNLPGSDDLDFNQERVDRFQPEDQMPMTDTDTLDPSMQHVWVAECYLKVDYNGDGLAEWRKITLAGGGGLEIVDNDECDGHPFCAWTPDPAPHKLYGQSLADKTMDIQLIKSTVWRQVLDGMYFNNAPQLVVMEGQANMEDVLTRRPGGVIRAKIQGAVQPLPVQDVSASGFNMINYLDSVREARTGVRRFSAGLDADAMNPYGGTATGAKMVDDSSQDRVMLLARNFAEQALVPLFRRMFKLTLQYQDKATTIRLRGKWENIDPSSWTDQIDFSVTVGLGTGNRNSQIGQLLTLLTQIDVPIVQQQGGMNGPLLTTQNVYNQISKLVEAMGYKNTNELFTDPSTAPPQPPQQQQDPAAQVAQAQIAIEKTKAEAQIERDKQKAVTDAALSQHSAALEAKLAEQRQAHEMQLAEQKQAHQLDLERMRTAADIEIAKGKAAADTEAKLLVAQHKAQVDADLALIARANQVMPTGANA